MTVLLVHKSFLMFSYKLKSSHEEQSQREVRTSEPVVCIGAHPSNDCLVAGTQVWNVNTSTLLNSLVLLVTTLNAPSFAAVKLLTSLWGYGGRSKSVYCYVFLAPDILLCLQGGSLLLIAQRRISSDSEDASIDPAAGILAPNVMLNVSEMLEIWDSGMPSTTSNEW